MCCGHGIQGEVEPTTECPSSGSDGRDLDLEECLMAPIEYVASPFMEDLLEDTPPGSIGMHIGEP